METKVTISAMGLSGDLVVPEGARALVLFAHGSGSGRHSPRNRYVAEVLRSAGLATLLADLLTDDEQVTDAMTGELRFDIDLLADRVVRLTDWFATDERTTGLEVGHFGASTGAAAALVAAARRPDAVGAVVSRGGRPDLAERELRRVVAPTLLIVGGRDTPVLRINRRAIALLARARLEIVPSATHLFEEPGALETVAELARDWFTTYLPRRLDQVGGKQQHAS